MFTYQTSKHVGFVLDVVRPEGADAVSFLRLYVVDGRAM